MTKGWFAIPGVQEGDRTLAQQLTGLDPLLAQVRDKTVLDLGCAEGLISAACVAAGAEHAHGIDFNAQLIATARKQHRDVERFWFEHADLNQGVPAPGTKREYHVVLMLAILHKLKRPFALLADVCKFNQPELIVIRLPEAGPVIVDARSDNEPHDVGWFLGRRGYRLALETRGHLNEWMGYFDREPRNS